jgi:hypothetical protein
MNVTIILYADPGMADAARATSTSKADAARDE